MAAAGPGQQANTSIDVPQDKVGLILGAQGATIKAIRAISGATCFVQQGPPMTDRAQVAISGLPAQLEKACALVTALVDGTSTPSAVGSIAAAAAAASGEGGSFPGARPGQHGPASLPPTGAHKGMGKGGMGKGARPGPPASALAGLVGSGGNIDPGKLAGMTGANATSLGSLSSLLSGVLSSGCATGAAASAGTSSL